MSDKNPACVLCEAGVPHGKVAVITAGKYKGRSVYLSAKTVARITTAVEQMKLREGVNTVRLLPDPGYRFSSRRDGSQVKVGEEGG